MLHLVHESTLIDLGRLLGQTLILFTADRYRAGYIYCEFDKLEADLLLLITTLVDGVAVARLPNDIRLLKVSTSWGSGKKSTGFVEFDILK